ncbi:hypothetical protein TRVA0_011S00562 [Trichomonascus vanleenenianus]|uniref:uncharacterized protein n=1 Tax=Trichomonascus vanleenenianus TaxID=2268995 RepID=UPI003EC96F6E
MSGRKSAQKQASSVVSGSSGYESPISDGRKRQHKRDEQIRKKLESELSKRRNQVGKTKQVRRPAPGSVLSLRPSPPLTMKLSTTIYEAAQFMSAKRENCVLVLDEDESICGIFTAKDLAFKIVGSGLDAKNLTIESIMTRDPLCARTDTSATEALNLMVSKGFRHLPVMDEDQNIAGVLDITKCFFEAMQKLERAYQSSRKLHDALEGVQSELGSSQPAQIIQYVEALRQQTEGPDLESVLDGRPPVFVDVRTPVSEAAALMKANRTTAVLVTDQESISGIFTSKDVVLRVIAAGLDPKNCSVVRVMTPQPDFAPKAMSIQHALRKMHDGHYLNLPVMGDENEVVGIVDVLRLTYATLEQINAMNNDSTEGPAWNKFWMSLDHDSESVHSDSLVNQQPHTPHAERRLAAHAAGSGSAAGVPELDTLSPPPDVSQAELAQFSIGDISPNDSVSRQGYRAALHVQETASELSNAPFPFKFKSPSGRIYRITLAVDNGISELRQSIIEKLSATEVATLGGEGAVDGDKLVTPGFAVSYIDDEGDAVAITTSQDLVDAITISRRCGLDKADLYIHHPDEQIEKPSVSPPKPVVAEKPPVAKADELIPGVPNELLLPGAIVTLAVSIVLVFSFRRN